MPGTATSTFNGNMITSAASYSSGMGVTWIAYDVTNYVIAGQTNIATSTSTGDPALHRQQIQRGRPVQSDPVL